eukprot:scaffold34623_cov274-Amphora_coffeaeformis.AAC.2
MAIRRRTAHDGPIVPGIWNDDDASSRGVVPTMSVNSSLQGVWIIITKLLVFTCAANLPRCEGSFSTGPAIRRWHCPSNLSYKTREKTNRTCHGRLERLGICRFGG